PGDGTTGDTGTLDPGTTDPDTSTPGSTDTAGNGGTSTGDDSTGMNGATGNGNFPAAPAGSTAVSGAIAPVAAPRNTPMNGISALANTGAAHTGLANTGWDGTLVPLALLLLAGGLLMLRKRKVS
ncbi:MAG: hypothetical protein ACTHL6_10425, partial [Arthrobacter sp.]